MAVHNKNMGSIGAAINKRENKMEKISRIIGEYRWFRDVTIVVHCNEAALVPRLVTGYVAAVVDGDVGIKVSIERARANHDICEKLGFAESLCVIYIDRTGKIRRRQ